MRLVILSLSLLVFGIVILMYHLLVFLTLYVFVERICIVHACVCVCVCVWVRVSMDHSCLIQINERINGLINA